MTMSRGGVRPPPVCADCSAPDPTWASVNRGVLICDECCSMHRSLGRHISIVKSLKKGQWSPSQHAMVYLLATSGANNIWEHTMLDPSQNRHGKKKPGPRDPLHPNKSDFIRAKYQFLSFINKQKDSEASTLDDVSKELHSSVRTNNVETCLRLLSKGADPNYFYREKGNCPMHVAAQAGQTAQIELLVVYGADPGIRDANGRTPVDYAKNEGFTDLAHRLVELQFELTDRLTFYICGRKPDHRAGQHFKIPQLGDHTADLSDLAKQAKKKLQDLPNHLFEELAMDVYDEVDRRENDSIWLSTHDHTSIVSERLTVPHLPVNPELSTTRNQGRQKLARFNAREFVTLVMDILNDARLRQTGLIQTPKEPDKLLGLKLLKRPQSKTISALSDEEPLYDSVASDEDYSSIDSQSIRSMHMELKEDGAPEIVQTNERSNTPTSVISFAESTVPEVEGPVTTEEFFNIRRALFESQAQVQQLVQVKSDLEKHLTEMQNKMESLMMENQTLRIHRDSMMVDHVTSGLNGQALATETELMRPPMTGQMRPTSMIEMRDASRQLAHSSPGSSGQLSGASTVSNISMTVTGQEQVSSDLEDHLNANVLEVIDDLPDAILSEAYDPPKTMTSQVHDPPRSMASQVYDPPRSMASQVFDPPKSIASQVYDPPRSVASQMFDPPRSVPSQVYDPPKASIAQSFHPVRPMGHEPPMSVYQGHDPTRPVDPHLFMPIKAAVSQGFNPTRAVGPQGPAMEPPKTASQVYETPKSAIPGGFDWAKAAISQGHDPARAAVSAGFEPTTPVSQAYELSKPVVPPGYDPSMLPGFIPPMAILSQGHEPPKAVFSQCYHPSGVILSQGVDPARVVSQGHEPARVVTSQGYDLAKVMASQGFDPARVIASQGFDPAKVIASQGFDPARVIASQGFDPAKVVASQGFDLARVIASQGFDPAKVMASQGYDPAKVVASQGFDPAKVIAPQGYDPAKVIASQGFDPARMGTPQGYDPAKAVTSHSYDPTRIIVSQGYDPAMVISQGYDPAKVISQGYDPAKVITSQGYDPTKAVTSQGYDPAKVVSQSYDSAKVIASQGNDPVKAMTSPGYDPAQNVASQGYDPAIALVSQGYEPSRPGISPGYEPPKALVTCKAYHPVVQGYDGQRVAVPQGLDLQAGVTSLGQDIPRPVVCQAYSPPSSVVPPSVLPAVPAPVAPPYDQTNPAVSPDHDTASAAVSPSLDEPPALPLGSDPSKTVVSQSQDPVGSLVSQPCVPPESLGTANHESPTPSVSQNPDLPHSLPAIPLTFDPPAPPSLPPSGDSATDLALMAELGMLSDPGFASDPGFGSGYDTSSMGHPQGFETPPPVIALGYDTPNLVLSQGCDLPSAVVSQGYEAPVAMLPQGYEATAMPAPPVAGVPVAQASDASTASQGSTTPASLSAPVSAADLQAQDIQSSGRESSETDDQDSTCSQPGVLVEGDRDGEEGKEEGGRVVVMPTQEEVVRKTEKVTRKIQELLQTAQEGNHPSFAPCSERIHVAVTDMAALFPDVCPTPKVQETLEQLTVSAQRLTEECRHWPPPPDHQPQPDFRLKTQQVIQFAYDIAKAAKKLVTLFQ